MIDLIERVRSDTTCEVFYVWFDTGLEYRATKEHLRYLENRYGVEIIRRRAKKSIPLAVRECGQPFVSKYVSEQMERLQRNGFQWEDEPADVLMVRYPRCTSAIKWWTNGWTRVDGNPGWFDIGRNAHLKEFIVENPPWFPISSKCCTYAKKNVAKDVNRELDVDVELVGVRKAEGGVRSFKNSCFHSRTDGPDIYRPIFWFSNQDKSDYCQIFDVRHSDCYEVWGFTRTGCVGCPFNRRVLQELEVAREYEPQMVRAVERVFSDAYEYTRMYREYALECGGQLSLGF